MGNNKWILIVVAIILIFALIVTFMGICIKKANKNAVDEENASFISLAIRALSDSTFRDLELANMIYTVGLSKSSFIKENFSETAKQTLESVTNGTAYESLLQMIPESLYGGKKITASINGVKGEPLSDFDEDNLIVGDLLFVTKDNTTKNYIYDKDGLVDLSNASKKIDTNTVLSILSESDIYAVFRPSLVIDDYDYITEKSPSLNLSVEQEAVIVTAKSYLLRGEKLQYADTRLGSESNSEFRWKAGYFSPEDYTSDSWGYTNCAAFTYDVYFNALGIDIHNGEKKLYTTDNQMNSSDELGIRKYHMICDTADTYTAEDKERIKNEIFDVLQPADILVVRRNGNGHSMLYIGNGNIIHSGGSVYNYGEAKENYEASIRQMRFEDYFFTEGTGGYIFGSDTGKNVSSFAILRPLDTFKGEIPEVTKNRIKNMQGIMAQKLSSHNIAKTVNIGEEITFTFDVYNSNDDEITINVNDTVPENTTYINGAQKVDGNKLLWTLTIPANSRKKVSYTVTVKEDVKIGTAIRSLESFVGGVPVRCNPITVNRTLKVEEQSDILKAIDKVKNNKKLKGLELVNKIYSVALDKEQIFEYTDFEKVTCDTLDGVFYSYGIPMTNGLGSYNLNSYSKYLDMVVPTMYGGRHFIQSSWGDRTRLAREHNLVVGDVLLRKTLQANQVFIYAGDGVFYNLTDGVNVDTISAKQRLETTLATGHIYAIVRPSFSFK